MMMMMMHFKQIVYAALNRSYHTEQTRQCVYVENKCLNFKRVETKPRARAILVSQVLRSVNNELAVDRRERQKRH